MDLRIASPKIAQSAWIAPGAVVTGEVDLADEASVWFCAVLRADTAPIRVGKRTNIQDGCVLHVNEGEPCILGDDVTVGHGAVVHAAIVEDQCLIGIHATILSRARIGRESVIAANALVPEGKEIPPGSLVMGTPGKVVRQLTDDERANLRQSAAKYVEYARAYQRET
ncbi:MAG: gamma carbonic anhydrase family protein [Cyanobacteria bacterium REEB65]|nr:gamma carbonic anhydrase family protein [Cyanobacteria bacterium REEB65]